MKRYTLCMHANNMHTCMCFQVYISLITYVCLWICEVVISGRCCGVHLGDVVLVFHPVERTSV